MNISIKIQNWCPDSNPKFIKMCRQKERPKNTKRTSPDKKNKRKVKSCRPVLKKYGIKHFCQNSCQMSCTQADVDAAVKSLNFTFYSLHQSFCISTHTRAVLDR